MNRKMSIITLMVAFMMLLSFTTSAFASEEFSEDLEFQEEELVNGTTTEEYVDEEGRNNKMVIEIKDDTVTASLYVEGILEQQSVANKTTNSLTGFSNYGTDKFQRKVSDLVTVETTALLPGVVVAPVRDVQPGQPLMPASVLPGQDAVINSIVDGGGSSGYTFVGSKKSAIVNSCKPKQITAYLYEKTTNSNSQRILVKWGRKEVITAIVSTIATAVVLKSPLSVRLLTSSLTGVGVSVVSGAIVDGFYGSWQITKNVKNYYGSVSGTKHFYNTITRETFLLRNDRTKKDSNVFLGEHISAYGKPKTYSLMLTHTIGNWGKGNC